MYFVTLDFEEEDTMSATTITANAGSNHLINQKPKLDYLKELSGGDLTFIAEILEMFINDAPQAVAQSFEHLEKKNFEMLRITVHKLKSSVQVVGGNYLTALICEIECAAAAKIDKPDMFLQMLSTLDSDIRQMVQHLNGELKEIKQ